MLIKTLIIILRIQESIWVYSGEENVKERLGQSNLEKNLVVRSFGLSVSIAATTFDSASLIV